MALVLDFGTIIAENTRLRILNETLSQQVGDLVSRLDNGAIVASHEERLVIAQKRADELQV